MNPTPANRRLFWNHRARNYPLPFERETYAKTGRILRLLGGLGVDFKGARLLDIGTGTGVYALRLAQTARSVVGVDSAPEMLKVFRAQRRLRGIKNAACVPGSWPVFPAARVAGRFDIALASMTMAVSRRADLLKMEKAAPLCVYIGWAGLRRNALLEKAYAHHGAAYRAPEGAANILRLLAALGRSPKVRYIRDSWVKNLSAEETMRDIEVGLKVNGASPDRPWLEALLKKKTRRGKIRQVTSVRKALIVWQRP